jgi:hypothetical protein
MYAYDKNKSEILTEPIEGTIADFLKITNDDEYLMSALFQIIYAIMVIQKKMKALHSFIGINSIFYKKINKKIKYFKYVIDGDEYIIPTNGYIFVIENFEHAQTLLDDKFNDLTKEDIEFVISYNYDLNNLNYKQLVLNSPHKTKIPHYESLKKLLKNKDKTSIEKIYSLYKKNFSDKKIFFELLLYCVKNNFLDMSNIKIDSEYKFPSNKIFDLINWISNSKEDIRVILKEYFYPIYNSSNSSNAKKTPSVIFNFDFDFDFDFDFNNKNRNNKLTELKRNNFNKNTNISYDLISSIKKLYQTNKFNISTSEYFYMYPNRNFIPKNLNPMYLDIKPYDYIEPIVKLNLRFKNSYYSKLIFNYNYDKKTNLILYKPTKLDDVDLDEIMLQYIKCRQKCFVITLWPIFAEYMELVVKYLEPLGNIYYTKYIEFEKNGLINYFASVYDEFSNKDILKIAKDKYSWSKLPNHTNSNKIGIIVFDNINDLALSGQASIFKTELRKWALNILVKNNIDIKNYRGNDLIHINDHFYQTIEYLELLLNKNSINLLNNRLSSKIYMDYFETSHLKIETYRKTMYENLSLETINSLFLIAGTSLYFYGFRPISDLDGICVNLDSEYKNKTDSNSTDIKKITKLFCDEKTRIFYIEFGATNTEYWKEKWTKSNDIIAEYFSIKDFNDICWNPKYHYYFKGIKCYLIDFEFYKKLQRSNEIIGTNIWPTLSKDYTDYIMINYLNPKLIENFIYIDKNSKKLTVEKKITDIYPKLISPLPFNNFTLDLINKFLSSKYKVYLNSDINDTYIKSLF